MHTHAWGFALLAILLAWTAKCLYHELKSPLRRVPGPRVTRFSRLWYFWTVWRGQAHHDIIALHRKHAPPGEFYAPIVRLGPNLYSISTADKAVYGISSKMPKSTWYEGWKHPSPERWNLFSDQDITRHNQTRKKFQAMYSLSSLLRYEGFVDQALDLFREKLQSLAQSASTYDMHHWLQCYAFDVVGSMTFGRRFGFLDEGKDIDGCMSSLESSMVYSTLVGIFPKLHPVLYPFLERLPGTGAVGRTFLMSFATSRIFTREKERADAEKMGTEEALSEGDQPRDFLDVVLDAEKSGQKNTTKYNVFMMAVSNIIAGSDTTAVSLSSILWHLAQSPDALERLRKELDESAVSSTNFATLQKLPYLQACIKEGLRLCSATGLPLWRVVPSGGAEIQGQFFPGGSEVGINTWVAHYDEHVWGSDAAKFRPERWLLDDHTELRRLEEHFMPVRDPDFTTRNAGN